MFDRYNIHTGVSHNSHDVRITEKRAPTDESVRLLREMEDKALGQVLEQIPLKDNAFTGQIIRSRDHALNIERVACVFSLNGNRLLAQVEIDPHKDHIGNYHALADEIAKVIAREIRIPLLTKGK